MSSLKMLREHLCICQTGNDWPSDIASAVDVLLNMIDRHRPLGSNGKHGNLHTATCGCDLAPASERMIAGAEQHRRFRDDTTKGDE